MLRQVAAPSGTPPPTAEKCPPELLRELLGASQQHVTALTQLRDLEANSDDAPTESPSLSDDDAASAPPVAAAGHHYEEVEVSTEESFEESTDEEGHESVWKYSFDHSEVGAPPALPPPVSGDDTPSTWDGRVVGGPPLIPPPPQAEDWNASHAKQFASEDELAHALWQRGAGAPKQKRVAVDGAPMVAQQPLAPGEHLVARSAAERAALSSTSAAALGSSSSELIRATGDLSSSTAASAAVDSAALLRRDLLRSAPLLQSQRPLLALKGAAGLTPPRAYRPVTDAGSVAGRAARMGSGALSGATPTSDAALPRALELPPALVRSIADALREPSTDDSRGAEGDGAINFAPSALDIALHLATAEAAGRSSSAEQSQAGALPASAIALALRALGVEIDAGSVARLAADAGAGDASGIRYVELLAHANTRGGIGFDGSVGDHRVSRRALLARLQSADAARDGTLYPAMIQMQLQSLGISVSSAQIKRIAARALATGPSGAIHYHRFIAAVGKRPRVPVGAAALHVTPPVQRKPPARAGALSTALSASALERMRALDANGSGYLSPEQISMVLARHFGINVPTEQVAAAARGCDADGGVDSASRGRIDYERLLEWMAYRAATEGGKAPGVAAPPGVVAAAHAIKVADDAAGRTAAALAATLAAQQQRDAPPTPMPLSRRDAVLRKLVEVEEAARARAAATGSRAYPPQCLDAAAIARAMVDLGVDMAPSDVQHAAVAAQAEVQHLPGVHTPRLIKYPTLVAALFGGADANALHVPHVAQSTTAANTEALDSTATRFMTAEQVAAHLRRTFAIVASAGDVASLAESCGANARSPSGSADAVVDFKMLKDWVLLTAERESSVTPPRSFQTKSRPPAELAAALFSILASTGFRVDRDGIAIAAREVASQSPSGESTLVELLHFIRRTCPSVVRFVPSFPSPPPPTLRAALTPTRTHYALHCIGLHLQIRQVTPARARSAPRAVDAAAPASRVHVSRHGSVSIVQGAAAPSLKRAFEAEGFAAPLTASQVKRAVHAVNARSKKSYGPLLPSNLSHEIISFLPMTPEQLLRRFSRRKHKVKQLMAVLDEVRWQQHLKR